MRGNNANISVACVSDCTKVYSRLLDRGNEVKTTRYSNNILEFIKRNVKYFGQVVYVMTHPGIGKVYKDRVLLFDTSIDTKNVGDEIIAHYCNRALSRIFELEKIERVPTHTLPSAGQLLAVSTAGVKIVCGTNLITPHFEEFSNWKMPNDLKGYRDIVTLGVGWGYYCDDISKVSKFVYKTIFSKMGLLSVRDSYTEQKFREMGITNVINTGCPTLWELTPSRCALIPKRKSSRVITTLTDYDRDTEADGLMFEILKQNYDEVLVWIQGSHDREYLYSLVDTTGIYIIENNIEAYTTALKMGNVDYVGTRLHAGIHAMNLGIRTIILAVDNRAIEMGKDFNLPVIKRTELSAQLSERINSEWNTMVNVPFDAIEEWKRQFR